jgi:hypothetical protein
MVASSVLQGMQHITSDPRQWSLPDAIKIYCESVVHAFQFKILQLVLLEGLTMQTAGKERNCQGFL